MSRKAMKAELLDAETELMLAYAWRDQRDEKALHRLINAYMRLAISMAAKFRRYGAPMNDLIQEAGLGLMKAADKFDPDRGVRFSTYAVWWIKASMQEFILRSWSLVKMGTTAAQKKLFFNLRRMKKQLDAYEDTDLHPDDVAKIAADLGVPEQEVVNMNRRMMMGGDGSLNTPMRGTEEGSGEWQDWLTDDGPLQDELVADVEEAEVRHEMLVEAMDSLNDREKHILTERRLTENPQTLEELSQVYDVSRERIRQIEVRAFEKLQKAMQRIAGERLLPGAA
ncbi:MAG TPA: RNA polymerase factor sigma-32 [Erythrobacter sp.]|nr:RNA polymerase factor sigma-32 [Erythrobacter sp.]